MKRKRGKTRRWDISEKILKEIETRRRIEELEKQRDNLIGDNIALQLKISRLEND